MTTREEIDRRIEENKDLFHALKTLLFTKHEAIDQDSVEKMLNSLQDSILKDEKEGEEGG